jgi:hypothetical protein
MATFHIVVPPVWADFGFSFNLGGLVIFTPFGWASFRSFSCYDLRKVCASFLVLSHQVLVAWVGNGLEVEAYILR